MEMDAVIGIMAYGFGDYRLLPRNNDDFVNINIELDPTFLPGSPLSVDEMNAKQFMVYPNPASDFINLITSEKINSITIFNIYGQKIGDYGQFENPYQIDISSFERGNYILKLKTENGELLASKFVVQ